MTNLVEGLSREIARVTEIKALYQKWQGNMLGANFGPAILMMSHDLEAAQNAMGGGDIRKMATALEALKGWQE